jgi:tyrosyl-tRNA synthetase
VQLSADVNIDAKLETSVLRWIVNVIVEAGFAKTNSEARRLIRGGAVRLDDQIITDETLQIPEEELDGKILQVGKRRYAKLVAPR